MRLLTQQKRRLIEITEMLLREEPDKWEFSQHEAKHPSGIEIWLSNRFYGTEIKALGVQVGGMGAGKEPIWQRGWRKKIVVMAEEVAARQLEKRLMK